jgi:hypothetical protein
MAARRFPRPWSVEDIGACFVVKDSNGQKLACVYYEEEPGRRSGTKLLTHDETRRIATSVVVLDVNGHIYRRTASRLRHARNVTGFLARGRRFSDHSQQCEQNRAPLDVVVDFVVSLVVRSCLSLHPGDTKNCTRSIAVGRFPLGADE